MSFSGFTGLREHYNDVIVARLRLKSPASRLFTQPFIQVEIKENIKALRHWPLCGGFTGTGEFPAQMASNAENVSIWWRHHGIRMMVPATAARATWPMTWGWLWNLLWLPMKEQLPYTEGISRRSHYLASRRNYDPSEIWGAVGAYPRHFEEKSVITADEGAVPAPKHVKEVSL